MTIDVKRWYDEAMQKGVANLSKEEQEDLVTWDKAIQQWDLQNKLWKEGTAPISEYKRVCFANRKLLQEIEQKRYNRREEAHKQEVMKLRKGALITLSGGSFGEIELFGNIKGKLLRKNKKTVTVQWLTGAYKGNIEQRDYRFICSWKERHH